MASPRSRVDLRTFGRRATFFRHRFSELSMRRPFFLVAVFLCAVSMAVPLYAYRIGTLNPHLHPRIDTSSIDEKRCLRLDNDSGQSLHLCETPASGKEIAWISL